MITKMKNMFLALRKKYANFKMGEKKKHCTHIIIKVTSFSFKSGHI